MTKRFNQFLMFYSASQLIKLFLKLKKIKNLMIFENSNMNIIKEDNLKMETGNKKSKEKSKE
jgi:hypothetical protein